MSKGEPEHRRVRELLDELCPGVSFSVKYLEVDVWQQHVAIYPVDTCRWRVLTPELERKTLDFKPGGEVEEVADYDDDEKPQSHCLRRTRYECDVEDYPKGKDLEKIFMFGYNAARKEIGATRLIRPYDIVSRLLLPGLGAGGSD